MAAGDGGVQGPAGDGRVPDRDALELRIAAWITKRAAFGRSTKAERAAALSALDMECYFSWGLKV